MLKCHVVVKCMWFSVHQTVVHAEALHFQQCKLIKILRKFEG